MACALRVLSASMQRFSTTPWLHKRRARLRSATSGARRHHPERDSLTIIFHRLFVAPVESDVLRKSAPKYTTSPPRTSIRRVDRASERERQRNVARRAAARIYGPVQRTLSASTLNQERPLPWIESPTAPDNGGTSAERLRSMQDSLREMAANDARRNQRMEEHMATVFGTSWHDLPPGPPAEEEQPEADLGWWSIDPRGRANRPRMVGTRLILVNECFLLTSSRLLLSPLALRAVPTHWEPHVRVPLHHLQLRTHPKRKPVTGACALHT